MNLLVKRKRFRLFASMRRCMCWGDLSWFTANTRHCHDGGVRQGFNKAMQHISGANAIQPAFAPPTFAADSSVSKEQKLNWVCDWIYRSSTARAALCEAIHEPSAELALRHLGEFCKEPAVWRDSSWALRFMQATTLTEQVELGLKRMVEWYTARRAPQKVMMEEPWDWYPKARLMRRSFVFHYGPTNSGKTHAALTALMKAPSGVYCAPLKALAGQVWRHINEQVPCDLLIGDERRFGGGAEHVSCTIEMTPIDLQVDVGVIDEIQMLGDRDRGWAWTRALLGLPAREIHLCGEERAISLVEDLLFKTFELKRLTLVPHKRLVPLNSCPPLNSDLSCVENGDCVVCFSRQHVLDLQRELSALPGIHTSYIYGAMPFEVREWQARTFNEEVQRNISGDERPSATASGFVSSDSAAAAEASSAMHGRTGASPRNRSVLVSTDAIAYGLNMNIERIVFASMCKYDGKSWVSLPAATAQQICGRAGRYGLIRRHAMGRYTTLHNCDLDKLQEIVKVALPTICRAGLFPTADILQLYVELRHGRQVLREGSPRHTSSEKVLDSGEKEVPEDPRIKQAPSFFSLMQDFTEACRSNALFFPCDFSRSLLRIAKLLERVPQLPLKDSIMFCYLPLNDDSQDSMSLLLSYATDHACGRSVALRVDRKLERILSGDSFKYLIGEHNIAGRYCGNAHRQAADLRAREIGQLERVYRQVEMYCWLSWRFGNTFIFRDEAVQVKKRLVKAMKALLTSHTP